MTVFVLKIMLFFSTNQCCAAQNRAEIIGRYPTLAFSHSIRVKKHSERRTCLANPIIVDFLPWA